MPVFHRRPKLMLNLSSLTFKTRVKVELEYLNSNSSVFSVIWEVTQTTSNSSLVKRSDFVQWKYYRSDRPLIVILMSMLIPWHVSFCRKVPQKSSREESTIVSGIKTTLQTHKVADCDHLNQFSQNRSVSRKLYSFSLWLNAVFRNIQFSM